MSHKPRPPNEAPPTTGLNSITALASALLNIHCLIIYYTSAVGVTITIILSSLCTMESTTFDGRSVQTYSLW